MAKPAWKSWHEVVKLRLVSITAAGGFTCAGRRVSATARRSARLSLSAAGAARGGRSALYARRSPRRG